jgi:uncharacterized membrane protein YdbT with pleckstrin-like domain
MENETRLKTSRKKFILLYIFVILVTALYPSSDFSRQGGIYHYIFFLLILAVILYIEVKRIYSSYIITGENVIEIKGIIAKEKRVIPFSSISHVRMKKSIVGVLLDFGDVIVTSFTNEVIVLEGISGPEKISELIERRIKQKEYKPRKGL